MNSLWWLPLCQMSQLTSTDEHRVTAVFGGKRLIQFQNWSSRADCHLFEKWQLSFILWRLSFMLKVIPNFRIWTACDGCCLCQKWQLTSKTEHLEVNDICENSQVIFINILWWLSLMSRSLRKFHNWKATITEQSVVVVMCVKRRTSLP